MLDLAVRQPDGIRRLITPVLGGAAIIAMTAFGVNSELVPRANERLATLTAGPAHVRGDREMTISELRAEADRARASSDVDAASAASRFNVEIQKKYAIAAASFVLALTAVAIVLLFPRGGVVLFTGAAVGVVVLYYVGLVAGESLADRLVLSPVIAMWMANGFFTACSLLVVWSRPRGTPSAGDSLPLPA